MFEIIIFSDGESNWLKNYYYKIQDGKEVPVKALTNLSKINIFVGSNNAGKSRFLRNVFFNQVNGDRNNNARELIGDIDYQQIVHDIEGFVKSVDSSYSNNKDVQFITCEYPSSSRSVYDVRTLINRFYTQLFDNQDSGYKKVITNAINNKVFNNANENNKIFRKVKYGIESLYIPVLRGMKPLFVKDSDGKNINQKVDYSWILSNKNYKFEYGDIYFSRVKRDYFNSFNQYGQPKERIFTGLSIYEDLINSLLGDLKERELIREYEEFLSEELFNNRPVALIPKVKSDVVHVRIGNEKEQPIHELGDGIQSIIILTFKMFLNKDKEMFFFIEEPEIFLHPEMQRKLLNIFKDDRFKKHQFFLTTHSNHLLDMTTDFSDISVYLFRKKEKGDEEVYEPDFVIENVSVDEVEILNELGVKNSSVFLSNCTIWVEGITDRFYIREYLKIYQHFNYGFEKYKEDIHYSFIEYSGNNISHWSFLYDEQKEFPNINYEKITKKVFLVADFDSEGESSRKEERFKKLEEKLGNNFYKLQCVEIENSLHEDIVKKVVFDYEKSADKDLQKIEDVKYKTDFINDDFIKIHLGKFIDEQLIDKKRKATYADIGYATGTIRDKIGFARKACNYMRENLKQIDGASRENINKLLSKPAQALITEIFRFIEENNR